MTPAHILFPVDFSERSTGTAPHVDAVARQFGSKVTLLHAWQPAPFAGYEMAIAATAKDLRNLLRAFAKEHLPKIETAEVLKAGEAAAEITRFALERGVDLIMMPSHGYGSAAFFWDR